MRTRSLIVLGALVLIGLLAGCASALQHAAERGDLQGVKTLLDQGAGANKDDLADAFVNAAGVGQLQIVELLLEKGVNLDARGSCDHPQATVKSEMTIVGLSRATALMCAAAHGEARTANFLLSQGADVNAKASIGKWDALHFAAFFGHSQIAKLLLDRGAEDVSGPIKLLKEVNRHPEIAQLLEQAEARQLGTEPAVAASPEPRTAPPMLPPAVSMPASDVDAPPARRVKTKPHAYAVVIGIEHYREKLPKADFADRDAKTVGEYLTKILGYPEENVVVRTNDKASLTDLRKYLETWLPNNVERDSSVFVYYSGHGAPNPKTGDAYLVPYDGDPGFVETTAYPLKQLYAVLDKLPAKDVTVVLDSCFSGAGGRSVIAKGMRPMMLSVENPVLASGKTVVLAASQGDQVSSTYDQKGHGLLTYYFLKGLRSGDGDLNKDGAIEMDELYEYVKPNVQKVARKQFNNEQTPQLLGNPDLLKRGIRLVERGN